MPEEEGETDLKNFEFLRGKASIKILFLSTIGKTHQKFMLRGEGGWSNPLNN